MADDDLERVWRALADPTRRRLLDLLREGPRTTGALAAGFETSRYAVMKHLGVLRDAGLVTSRHVGRRTFHYLNAVPIRQIHDRWISRYAERWAAALVDLKTHLEVPTMSEPTCVFEIYIRTTPEELWRAITEPDFTRRYFHSTMVESDWRPGSPMVYRTEDGREVVRGEVVEADAPRRLVMTWQFTGRGKGSPRGDAASRVTWEIEPVGETCKLTLIHDGFAGETETYRTVKPGWPPILSSLKSLLETGEPLVVAR